MRLPTVVIVLASGSLILWANIRPVRVEGDVAPPDRYGPVARELFFRGWPLSPWMLCSFHGGKWHPEEDFCWWALIIDAIVAAASVGCVWFLCEWFMRTISQRRRKKERRDNIP